MEKYMQQAISLAKQAAELGEVPVGAVIVQNGKVIATGTNRRETDNNAIAHAETEAIATACKKLGRWCLDDCELYVTLEPCPMCAGAIINSRIRKVVFGAFDKKGGACDSIINLFNLPFNHKPEVWAGICEAECSDIMKSFFEALRKKAEK